MLGLVLKDHGALFDDRVGALAIGPHMEGVERAFPCRPAADQTAGPLIAVAALEQQPVRRRGLVATGGGIPQLHGQIRRQRLVRAGAVFGVLHQPSRRDLAGGYAFGLGDLGAGQAVGPFGGIDLAVVFAVFDDDAAVGSGFQHVEIALPPALGLGPRGDVDPGIDLLGVAVRIGDSIPEGGVRGFGRRLAQHQGQGVVGIDADMAVAGLRQDADTGNVAVAADVDGGDAAGLGGQRIGGRRQGHAAPGVPARAGPCVGLVLLHLLLHGLARDRGGRGGRGRAVGFGRGGVGLFGDPESGLAVEILEGIPQKARRCAGGWQGRSGGRADDLRGRLDLDLFGARCRRGGRDDTGQGDKKITKQHFSLSCNDYEAGLSDAARDCAGSLRGTATRR